MSRRDKIEDIKSFLRILLIPRIKYDAENPPEPNPSWDRSIENSLDEIDWRNSRGGSGPRSLDEDGLKLALEETWPSALKRAAKEIRRGSDTSHELAGMVDRDTIVAEALLLIKEARTA
jgi:hypothetical protein